MQSLVGFFDLSGLHAYNGITAITRSSSNMEVFYSSDDNTIHSRYWTPGGGWKNSGQDKSINSAAGTGIAGVSREASHMEIFYVGNNGNLMHSYSVDSGSNWVTDAVLAGSDWGTPANKGIGALSSNDQSQEVWWITTTGAINYAPWNPLNGWEYSSLRAAGTAHPNSGMAVLARSNVRRNIFYIGNDQRVYQGYWQSEQPNIWRFEKLSDMPAAIGSLTAVSMNSQHMEVFWTAPDGTITHAYWYENTGKWTSASMASNIYCVPGGSITATSRKDGFMLVVANGMTVTFMNPLPSHQKRSVTTAREYQEPAHLVGGFAESTITSMRLADILACQTDKLENHSRFPQLRLQGIDLDLIESPRMHTLQLQVKGASQKGPP
ncbi:uncharacterized protein TRIVIDRAFT_223925 [Trichoderma virens Gv29-8]|uniref:Fucose-specific lectin n=1 Tax=Hypocrea virens (strain Gv29-8 / FGSC 10586) TaxID=413071 RepID=G9MYI9_HYPVG|nr:uncharacterized protein TRIVIDRAFT_223925 [Trichoderma virens Gv29-8]EHK20609.1 hypothetical protein TRIVIDRAFT_223925 [Trichoderma virens Gv29-8]UKZ53070.1 hypothetical protein TrVGV298_006857 [Trichoderma virens]